MQVHSCDSSGGELHGNMNNDFPRSNGDVPTSVDDPVNAAILAVAEDRLEGFQEYPFEAISERTGVPADIVCSRLDAMLSAGVIRRIRQTIHASRLSPGALVAWRITGEAELQKAFDWLVRYDPFTGHIVIRESEYDSPASAYRLWTTLRVPVEGALERHCHLLKERIGAVDFVLLPARAMFTLGVGHIRRRHIKPGDRTDVPVKPVDLSAITLDEQEWRILSIVKRELDRTELHRHFWACRAEAAGLRYDEFIRMVQSLAERGLFVRFAAFIEHTGDSAGRQRTPATDHGLFQWSITQGSERDAGDRISRFHVMTHVYWREGDVPFDKANLWGMAHGCGRDALRRHKQAIDRQLEQSGLHVGETNIFWSCRSVVRPSEILPDCYQRWAAKFGLTGNECHVREQ